MSLTTDIQKEIQTHQLIQKGQRVLVGVSGGADSIALLHVLHSLSQPLGFSLTAAHLHHGTRAEASDADQRHVKETCQRLGVPFVTRQIDIPARVKANRQSLEMEARTARHEFFADTLKSTGATAVALAHTADDQAENFLLKLSRGAGLRGLAGMNRQQELNGLRIIRPMLCATRAEIEHFLTSQQIEWREDASNADTHHKRNSVRHDVLPYLELKLNPNLRKTLLRTMDILRDEDDWISSVANTYLETASSDDGQTLFGERLISQHPAARRRVIINWLLQNHVPQNAIDYDSVSRIDQLMQSADGTRRCPLTDQLRVINQYGELRIEQSAPGQEIAFELEITPAHGILKDEAAKMGDYPSTAAIDAEKAGDHPIIVRTAREGDRMQPLGMTGTRKLQDIFVDQKVPRDARPNLPVVECNGEIIWLPGYRIAEPWKLKTATSPSLHLRLMKI